MALRERRLRADAAALTRLSNATDRIHIVDSEGDPPERYVLEYAVEGLVVQGGEVGPAHQHRVEIFLTLAYPRQAPQCRMLTPVFHPNIAPHAVCIGDHWSAGESLVALVIRIAEMITFQSYNVKSPLNGDAARWAETHVASLPLSEFDFGQLLASLEDAPVVIPTPAAATPHQEEPVQSSLPLVVTDSAPRAEEPRERTCPTCGAALSIPPGWTASWVRCPMCGRIAETDRI